jgi:hypothetical protein
MSTGFYMGAIIIVLTVILNGIIKYYLKRKNVGTAVKSITEV